MEAYGGQIPRFCKLVDDEVDQAVDGEPERCVELSLGYEVVHGGACGGFW